MAKRSQQVEELFHEALSRKPPERELFLTNACSSDPSLRAEVESLISAYEQPGSFLESPAYEVAAELIDVGPAQSLVGRCVGHYELTALVGRGGMGDVYLAYDKKLDRRVALKLLPGRYTADEVRLRRFVLEARAASSLNHPNIITIHEIGTAHEAEQSVHFIAAEFIDGVTLRKRLSGGQIGVSEAVDIALQVASALATAHAAGIVHRDIKPENIMLRPDGYVKVLDFGLAKLTEQQSPVADSRAATRANVDTDPGIVMGTVSYMSPEQARGQSVDARSDIFSLGVVIYEMVAGRLPFEGDNAADLIASILKTEPPPLDAVQPELPALMKQIVTRALSKVAADRYQTCEELLSELKKARRELESPTTELHRASQPSITEAVVSVPNIVPFRFAGVFDAAAVMLTFALLLKAIFSGVESTSLADLHFVELLGWKNERSPSALDARFSPSGDKIAFTQRDQSKGIWVQDTRPGAAPALITQPGIYAWPVWSPDGEQVAFFSTRNGQAGIWTAPAIGGESTLLKELTDNNIRPRLWARDGETIYYEAENNLYSLDIKSGAATQLTAFPSSLIYRHISVSPDEDRITYTHTKDGQIDVWAANIRGGDAIQLTDDPAEDWYPLWHPDGNRIVYTSDRSGFFQICVAYLDGSNPLQVTIGGEDHRVSDVSSDGTKLLDVTTRVNSDIFATYVESGKEREVTSGIGLRFWPEVSPDGQTVAYHSAKGIGKITNSAISVIPASGGPEKQLTSDSFSARWSPDSSQLAFSRFDRGETSILAVSRSGGDVTQLASRGVRRSPYGLLPANKNGRDISWSPDGGKVAYCSRKSGALNLWTVNADGTAETQLTNNTDSNLLVYWPIWSPDGQSIASTTETRHVRADGTKLWGIWFVSHRKVEIVYEDVHFLRPVDWSVDGSELIVATDQEKSGAPSNLSTVSLFGLSRHGLRRHIRSLESTYISSIALSPDRLTIAFVAAPDRVDNIYLMPSEGGRAKRITSNADPRLYIASPSWSPDGRAIYYGKQTGSGSISMIENFR